MDLNELRGQAEVLGDRANAVAQVDRQAADEVRGDIRGDAAVLGPRANAPNNQGLNLAGPRHNQAPILGAAPELLANNPLLSFRRTVPAPIPVAQVKTPIVLSFHSKRLQELALQQQKSVANFLGDLPNLITDIILKFNQAQPGNIKIPVPRLQLNKEKSNSTLFAKFSIVGLTMEDFNSYADFLLYMEASAALLIVDQNYDHKMQVEKTKEKRRRDEIFEMVREKTNASSSLREIAALAKIASQVVSNKR